jgi:hypothetical protein
MPLRGRPLSIFKFVVSKLLERCPNESVPNPQQLRQPRDVQRDPPRLVLRQHLRLPCFGIVVAGIDEHERLTLGVADDVAAGHLVGMPGRRKAARLAPGVIS